MPSAVDGTASQAQIQMQIQVQPETAAPIGSRRTASSNAGRGAFAGLELALSSTLQ